MSLGDRYRKQINYVTINKRFRNAMTKVKTFPGADCDGNCDHVPVVAVVKLKLKNVKRAKNGVRKDWSRLKTETSMKEEFELKLRDNYQALEERIDEEPSVNTEWNLFTKALIETGEETVPNERRRGRQRWMTEGILTKMVEGRKHKRVDQKRCKLLDREIRKQCSTLKETWLIEKCLLAEQPEGGDSKKMFDLIREVTGEKSAYIGEIIKDRHGSLLTDSAEVMR